jgi:asparagine synthase (glutamine-hydrolysing)
MLSLSTAWKIWRDLGASWVLNRTLFAAQARFGVLERRLPVSDWEFAGTTQAELEECKRTTLGHLRTFFPSTNPSSFRDDENVCRQAERILEGEWPFFFHDWLHTGFPPDWHRNARDGKRVDDQRHWSRIDLNAIRDVKFVWEPSRFSIVYLLARAYGVSRDERYAEAFWTLVEDWAAKNPPNRGLNWASGQEAAFRVMAWCFALQAFRSSPASTAQRVVRLVQMMEKHGERVAGFIDYAISQRNNHGISEAVGLFTIGVLFPELPRATDWAKTGRELIVSQLSEQVYEDGSYVQHSFNYQRVMLDDLTWAFRLGELSGQPLPSESYGLIARAMKFMIRFCDSQTGRVPNCCGNDGSLVLPLSSCDYSDFRPSVQAAHYLTHRTLYFGNGRWNEMVERLFGEIETAPTPIEVRPDDSELESNQYLKLQGPESHCMLHASKFHHRPAHADQLHLDLWWRGENIACDAGSYLYNGDQPCENGLAGTSVHNTVTIEGRDQMTRQGRFLWLDWAQAGHLSYEVGDFGTAIEAWHNGYRILGVIHRRSVLALRDADAYIVVDDIVGPPVSRRVRLHWLFPDYRSTWKLETSSLNLQTPAGEFRLDLLGGKGSVSIARAGELVFGNQDQRKCETEVRGWCSLYYGEKLPALSLAIEVQRPLPVRLISVLAPMAVEIGALSEDEVTLRSSAKNLRITLGMSHQNRVFRETRWLLD